MATIKSIEEKAKAYDIALDKIKRLLGTGNNCSREDLEYVFPGLTESKDDLLMEKLINAFLEATDSLYMVLTPLEREAFIAWLEKQSEHKKFRDNIQVGDKVTRNEDGILVNLSQLNRVAKKDEKQGGHKLAEWSEEDEQYLLVCKNALAKYQVSDKWDATIISRWLEDKLKSLRPQSHWKPSDEQMAALQNAIGFVGELTTRGCCLKELKAQLEKLREE